MEIRHQQIKSEEQEERELLDILHEVGKTLRERASHKNPEGLTYQEFKTRFLKTQLKENIFRCGY